MKLAVRIVVIVLVVVILALVAGLIFIDQITASGIRQSSAYATGVDTSLRSADVGVTSGNLDLRELVIGNPEGYESDHFFSLGEGHVDVTLGSLMADTVEVPMVRLTDVSIVIEKKDGKANYEVILENLEKLSGDQPPRDQPEEAGKGVVIEELRIENITARIKGYPFPSDPVEIPAIVLHDLPEGAQDAASVAEVVGIVIAATLKTVAGSIADLPGELASGITEGLGPLGDIGQQSVEQIGEAVGAATEQAREAVGEAAGAARDAADEAASKARQGVDQAKEKLGGLLGGGGDDDDGSSQDDGGSP